jgi:hypothetical protein
MSYASETKRILTQKLESDQVKSTADTIDILEGCTLIRVGVLITVIADAVVTTVVTRRVTTGSDTNAVAVDSIVIPDTTAVGKIVYCDITPMALDAGDQLLFTCDGGGTSTAFVCFAVVIPNEEPADNEADMVESA